MFNTIIFNDEITLWWDREEFDKNASTYSKIKNG